MDRKKRPLAYHVRELRNRLLRVSCVFLLVTMIAYIYGENIFSFLIVPIANLKTNHRLIFTDLTEVFSTYVRLGLCCGALVGLPLLFNELWRFLIPGLKLQERKMLKPVFVLSPSLFFIGVLFAYFIVLPNVVTFFASFEVLLKPKECLVPLVLEARVGEYFSLFLQIVLAFGVAFQLPVVIYIAHVFEIVNIELLKSSRRIACILILIISAILTPPDVMSMIVLALPLYGLYEVTILFLKNRAKNSRVKYA